MRLATILFLICLFACKGEIDMPITFPIVVVDEVDVTTSSGIVKFTAHIIPNSNADKILRYGFIWGHGSRVVTEGAPGEKFSRSVSRDLAVGDPGDAVRAFVETGTNTIYSNPVRFKPKRNKPPRFEKFEPAEGFDGTDVKITFSNYQYRSGDRITLDGTVACDIVSAADSIVTVKIPLSYLIGPYNPVISTLGLQTSSIPRFTILGPSIVSLPKDTFVPNEKVIITAEYLDHADSFEMNFEDHTGQVYQMTFSVLSSKQIEATLPNRSNTQGRIRLEAKVGNIKKISWSPNIHISN